jgi:hypothetical protein
LNELKAIGYELSGIFIERKNKNNPFSGMKCITLSYKKGEDIETRFLKDFLNKDDKKGLKITRTTDKYSGIYGDEKDFARIKD